MHFLAHGACSSSFDATLQLDTVIMSFCKDTAEARPHHGIVVQAAPGSESLYCTVDRMKSVIKNDMNAIYVDVQKWRKDLVL